jgi:hypothetical protein
VRKITVKNDPVTKKNLCNILPVHENERLVEERPHEKPFALCFTLSESRVGLGLNRSAFYRIADYAAIGECTGQQI